MCIVAPYISANVHIVCISLYLSIATDIQGLALFSISVYPADLQYTGL